MDFPLYPLEDEDLTDLFWHNYKLLQKKQGFRFSVPSVCLAHFAALEEHMRIMELGLGSGVVSVLLYGREQSLLLHGVEIQEDAAILAKRNFLMNQIPACVFTEDFRTLGESHYQQYDLVITNPPYFPLGKGKVNPQDPKAIARHEINGTLEDVISHAGRLLKRKGNFTLVHLPARLTEILSLCAKYRLYPKRLQFVYHRADEDAQFVLLEACKDVQQPLQVLPPLVIYQDETYSETFRQMLGGDLE